MRPTNYAHGVWQNAVLGSASDVAKKYASKVGNVPGVLGAVDVDISYKDYPSIIRKLGLNHLTASTPAPKIYQLTATKSGLTQAQATQLKAQADKLGLITTIKEA